MAAQQWWVVGTNPGRGVPVKQYQAVQAAKRPLDYAAGPFATQADAQAWITAHTPQGFSIPDPFSGITGVAQAAGEFSHWTGLLVAAVTDIHTWISLGWLWLGIVLFVVGVLFWMRAPQRAAAMIERV